MIGAQPARTSFLALLQGSLGPAGATPGGFVKLLLAKYRGPEPQLNQLLVRRVLLRNESCLSLVYRHTTRDITKNLPIDDGLRLIDELLGGDFRNAHLHTTTEEVQLAISQRGQCTLRTLRTLRTVHTVRAPNTLQRAADASAPVPADASSPVQVQAPTEQHDRARQHPVPLGRPFLAALGVTDAQQRVVPAMARKWKQINKFVEVFSHALASSTLATAREVRVMDFGSGKGYLTFAVHDHLCHAIGVNVQVTGVELRPDMVALCNAAAERLGLQGLHFEQGDVGTVAPPAFDVMIALHACDTATDHAIHKGIRAGAAIILCSPCCHKQLRPQLLSPHPLRPILQHGVHLGQEAEMLTDGLRALLLESRGYQTQVFEFVSLEHTQKNKMILAIKRARPVAPCETDAVLAQIDEIKRFYGIREQCLESLLALPG